jgi:hypothetical protein
MPCCPFAAVREHLRKLLEERGTEAIELRPTDSTLPNMPPAVARIHWTAVTIDRPLIERSKQKKAAR